MAEDLIALTPKAFALLRADHERLKQMFQHDRRQSSRRGDEFYFLIRQAVLAEDLAFEAVAEAHFLADHRGASRFAQTATGQQVPGGVSCRYLQSGQQIGSEGGTRLVTIALIGVYWQIIGLGCPGVG